MFRNLAFVLIVFVMISCEEQPTEYDIYLHFPDEVQQATVSGTVSTSFGYGLSYVEIDLGDYDDISDKNGNYYFANIEPGRLELRVNENSVYHGFSKSISIDSGDQIFDFHLDLKPISPDIRVSIDDNNNVGGTGTISEYGGNSPYVPLVKFHLYDYYSLSVRSAIIKIRVSVISWAASTGFKLVDIPSQYNWTSSGSGGLNWAEFPSYPVLFETAIALNSNEEIILEYDLTDYINSILLGVKDNNGLALLNTTGRQLNIGYIELTLK